METHASLIRLSALLNLEIRYANVFRIPYILLAERWVLTESFESKNIELNDLETYTWHEISEEELSTLINIGTSSAKGVPLSGSFLGV